MNAVYHKTRLLSRCRNPGNISPLVGRGKPHVGQAAGQKGGQ